MSAIEAVTGPRNISRLCRALGVARASYYRRRGGRT